MYKKTENRCPGQATQKFSKSFKGILFTTIKYRLSVKRIFSEFSSRHRLDVLAWNVPGVINQTRLDQHSPRTAQTITAKVCVSSCILLKVCTLLFNTNLFCKFINKFLFFTSGRSCSIIVILKVFHNSLEF